MVSGYSYASNFSSKKPKRKLRARPVVLTNKELEEKIKSGAATLK